MDFPAWDPVLFDLPGPLDIRWYGLMYVFGFLVGQQILVRLSRAGLLPVDPKVAPDLVFYCVIGVMLGGRTGYALFYDQSLLWPAQFVKVWTGGLSFHGGLSGVAVALWLFARKYKVSWGRVADACCIAVTPGIFAVRCANFINGELYGRETAPGTWGAMQFPTDPEAEHLLGLSNAWQMRDRELCIQVAYGHRTFDSVKPQLSTVGTDGQTIDWAHIAPKLDWEHVRHAVDRAGNLIVPFRHPSQLYEGICEGILVGALLFATYLLTRKNPWRQGRYAVLFLLGYAVARWSLENLRQPDAQFGKTGIVFLGMTMGQTLSTAMIVGAGLMLLWPKLVRRKPASLG